MSEGDIDLTGVWRAAVADDALRREFPRIDLDDRDWENIEVPSHWRATAGFATTDGPILYRRVFTVADPGTGGDRPPGDRWWLALDGIFYTSDVWLDGGYLGDTEGYFAPLAFEVTDQLTERDDHVLALEVSCHPPSDRTAKRNLTGVFQHWDLLDQDWNPGGIWNGVRVERSGPVRIRHLRVVCRDANPVTATVFVRAVLDAATAGTHEIVTEIAGVEHREARALAAGENRLEWTVTVADPRLWWPRALGAQPLEDVRVAVHDLHGGCSDERTRRIGLRRVEFRDWTLAVNGERMFLKGANQGPTAMALAEATAPDARRVVDLAVDAGLDFLRIHAHVAIDGLYDAADEAGLLLWQDMPLQWGYHRSIRAEARRQAREMVDLLAHHPSIFVWCGHNEPMAIDVEPATITDNRARAALVARAVAGQVLPTWNRSILDYSIKRVLEHTDGSRPVVPHSGIFPHPPQLEGTDTHTYFGWYYGDERWFERAMRLWPRLARFVTEFGAQAVPEDASFLEPDRWPDLDWDRAYRNHALQRPFFDIYVPPDRYETFDEWRAATQAYQAQVIKHHVETLRRIKYRPCGGFAQFCFADGFPSVTWSVLGHDRAAKAGYAALAEACRPVIVVADRLPASVRPGDALGLDIHVVSDRHIALADSVVTAYLSWGDGPPTESEPGPRSHTWRWTGEVPPDSCVRVATIQAVVPDATGDLRLELAFEGGGDRARNTYTAPIVGGRSGPVPLGT